MAEIIAVDEELKRVRNGSFPEDGISFSSDFPSGNGQYFEKIDKDIFCFHIRVHSEPFAQFFNLEIRSRELPRTLRLQVADGIAWGKPAFSYTWYKPVFSIDEGLTWQPAVNCQSHLISKGPKIEDQVIEYTFTIKKLPFRFASVIPHPLKHLKNWITQIESKYGQYLKVESSGKSVRKIDIPILHITDSSIPAKSKSRIFIISGQHPSETEPRFVLERIIELIISNKKILRNYVFEIIPLLNVDGVFLGRSYSNVNDVNLSTAWQKMEEPEICAAYKRISMFRPDIFIDMHSGDFPYVARLLYAMSEKERRFLEMDARVEFRTISFGHIQPIRGRAPDFLYKKGLIKRGFLIEVPRFPNDINWHQKQAEEILNFLMRFADRFQGPREKTLKEYGYSFQLNDFLEKLPGFYYTNRIKDIKPIAYNFEVNGLELVKGKYDIYIEFEKSVSNLKVSIDGESWHMVNLNKGRELLFKCILINNRKISFNLQSDMDKLPSGEVIIVPTGSTVDKCSIKKFTEYRRNSSLEERPLYRKWQSAYEAILSTEFPLSELKTMFGEIVEWSAQRQVQDRNDPHYGAIYSEEDKYSFRDAACAAVAFMHRYRETKIAKWKERARAVVDYCYQGQRFEAGPDKMGGFGEMGMLDDKNGRNFRRVTDSPSIVSGVETGIIACQLVNAFELGLTLEKRDIEALRHIAIWFDNNEYRWGQFRHHEGAKHDCQNSNAIGAAALTRISNFFQSRDLMSSPRWLVLAKRALIHFLEGQEAIGEWPYIFARTGRGQQYHWKSIPDQGMGLYHLLQCDEYLPFRQLIDESGCLPKIAYWYLLTSRFAEDGTIILDYESEPGNGIGFSCFTWCRFMACASIAHIWERIGNKEFWQKFVLSQLKFIKQNLWNSTNPKTAPVRSSVIPLKLHSWIQTAEWDAVLLHEIIDKSYG